MSTLNVSGAELYYETRGAGPVMLLIPGANGDTTVFESLAERLSAHYLVVSYDRRGFSRSRLDGPQDYARRLETDAADARRLIEHVSGGKAATVFGTSSGAVVALRLLLDRPDVIGTVVLFEPCAMRLQPDGQRWIDLFRDVYDLYRRRGTDPALATFRETAFPPVDHAVMQRARSSGAPHVMANAIYWFERELRQYTSVDLDAAALQPWAHRIIPAVGRECRGYPNFAVSRQLGLILERDLLELPGGHVGFVTHCDAFADALLARLHQERPE
jgi:pimeloyl-ACP methyl ester carboxylesterase